MTPRAKPLLPFAVPSRLCRSLLFLLVLSVPAVASVPSRANLADAVEKKDLASIRTLLPGSAVNATQVDGMTALHWAAHHDDLARLAVLKQS